MHVHIAKVNGILFSGTAEALIVPGSEGELTILTHHVPLVTALRAGHIIVRSKGAVLFTHPITHGILEVTPTEATVLL